jgi:hypothetical protein
VNLSASHAKTGMCVSIRKPHAADFNGVAQFSIGTVCRIEIQRFEEEAQSSAEGLWFVLKVQS